MQTNNLTNIYLMALRPFLSATQRQMISALLEGAEGQDYEQKLIELNKLTAAMPMAYEQDGKGDQTTLYLHYSLCNTHWYITEKDVQSGLLRAYGYAVLYSDTDPTEDPVGSESETEISALGYISILELTRLGAELDLNFTPCVLAQIKSKHAA